jgi:hypothetical protein
MSQPATNHLYHRSLKTVKAIYFFGKVRTAAVCGTVELRRASSSLVSYVNMTSYRSFEEVMAERMKTLDGMRATIERIRYLIDIITEQIKLEQQWTASHQLDLDKQAEETLGDGA